MCRKYGIFCLLDFRFFFGHVLAVERTILYVNPLAFPIAVERRLSARLGGRPVALAPGGTDRAVVWSASPEAALAGIEAGMPIYQALRRCPGLLILPPRLARALQRRADRRARRAHPSAGGERPGQERRRAARARARGGPAPRPAARATRRPARRRDAPRADQRPGHTARDAAAARRAPGARHAPPPRECRPAGAPRPLRRPPRGRRLGSARSRDRPRRPTRRRRAPAPRPRGYAAHPPH